MEKEKDTRQKRKPALVLPSQALLNLLELANIVPSQQPALALRSQGIDNRPTLQTWRADYQNSIFNWAAKIIDGVDDKTLRDCWLELKVTLGILSPALQVFVLFDEQGEESSADGINTILVVNEDTQISNNLSIIRNEEVVLKTLAEEATNKIESTIRYEFEGDLPCAELTPQFSDADDLEHLLRRALRRFIFAFGVRAIFEFLTNPELKAYPIFDFTHFQSFAVSSHLEVYQSGLIHFTPSVVVRALESVEVGRIRICLNCSNFYWAGRKDMRCCSTSCADALRMREYRMRSKTKNKTGENNYGENK